MRWDLLPETLQKGRETERECQRVRAEGAGPTLHTGKEAAKAGGQDVCQGSVVIPVGESVEAEPTEDRAWSSHKGENRVPLSGMRGHPCFVSQVSQEGWRSGCRFRRAYAERTQSVRSAYAGRTQPSRRTMSSCVSLSVVFAGFPIFQAQLSNF